MKRFGDVRSIADALAELGASGIRVPALPKSRETNETPDPEAAARRERYAALEALGWPTRALDVASGPELRDNDSIRALRAWDPGKSALMLTGGKGAGKTVATAGHAMRDPARTIWRFARAARLARESRFSKDWRELLDAPKLCIDDLGAEYIDTKGSFVADLDELVDVFYASQRPLIITSNLGGDEFTARYGARVSDRLVECSTWIGVREESYRTRAPWERKR